MFSILRTEEFYYIIIGYSEDLDENTFAKVEGFVCNIYGKKKITSVNEVRLDIFLQKYKPKNDDDAISCVKKMDGSFLPPCSRVVKQKLRRTNLIVGKWISSISPNPPSMSPINSGWILDNDGHYRLNWFEGDMSPSSLDVCTEKVNDIECLDAEGKSF